MRKLALTFAIVLTMGLGASAQSLLGRESSYDESYRDGSNTTTPIVLPGGHGDNDDADGSPLGTGIAVLTTLGAAYLVGKKRKKD